MTYSRSLRVLVGWLALAPATAFADPEPPELPELPEPPPSSATPQPPEPAPAPSTETAPTSAAEPFDPSEPLDPEWGSYEPGAGFRVARTPRGSLAISAYMLLRYLDQRGNDSFTDHLGGEQPVDRRRDIQLHRVFVFLNGFVLSPRLRFNVTLWSVLSIQQGSIIGLLTYELADALRLSAGISGLPGTRSMQNVSPYHLGTDRQMADEFFKPGATAGVWASGRIRRGLYYTAMLGNSLNQVGVNALQLTRAFAQGASVVWMPTTGDFGPRGGFGDYERHVNVATRFGVSFTHSRENRFDQLGGGDPENMTIRLSDSTPAFRMGSIAPGVTLQDARFWLVAADAGVKYRGLHVQGEYYYRRLDRLVADGPLPQTAIVDHGFYVQAAYQLMPTWLGVYGVTSVIFGEFNRPWEVGGGANIYPLDTRDLRLNLHAQYVDHSPVSNLFGYYVGGQTGPTLSLAVDLLF